MFVFTLLVIGLLLLAFKSTRLTGIAGLTLLSLVYWEFYALSNGGFHMSPSTEQRFHLSCPNGNDVELSADALGIVCCLYAYSLLSFERIPVFSETCAEQYHLLREFMYGHAEVGAILRAID